MPAYVISEVEILEESAAARYRELASASIGKYGGRYLARAADPAVVEGREASGKIVLVEFPSLHQAREWYSSAEYAEALGFRDAALRRRLMFVDGV